MNLIKRMRRWLLLDLTGAEFYFPRVTYYHDDGSVDFVAYHKRRVVSQSNPINGRDEWWCGMEPDIFFPSAAYSGANIRRAYRPGKLWKPYLTLLEAIGYKPRGSNWRIA